MIESPAKISISNRILNLLQQHETEASYQAHRLYLGEGEFEELRREVGRFHSGPAFNLPPISFYQQGSHQFMGKAIFVLKDLTSHLALA
jgi:hypothetical protein